MVSMKEGGEYWMNCAELIEELQKMPPNALARINRMSFDEYQTIHIVKQVGPDRVWIEGAAQAPPECCLRHQVQGNMHGVCAGTASTTNAMQVENARLKELVQHLEREKLDLWWRLNPEQMGR